jgi:FMN phosphatase YigB (HAD superfamily)
MNSTECVVFDFDGTFTRVDEEAEPFVAAFRRELAEYVGRERIERWDAVLRTIEDAPERFGWEYEGVIVAPAHADPYIRCTTIGQVLLAEEGIAGGRQREVLEGLFKRCYPLTRTVFREDAKFVLEVLLGSGMPVFVISNSATDHVRAKIEALEPRGKSMLRIYGNARKFVVCKPEKSNPEFESLPSEMYVPGLERPLLLHRGYYFDALKKVWDETGARPERTLVCGDIFELDLAMPARLGTQVHLVARPGTPDYELRAARTSPGGGTSQELIGLLDRLDLPG